MKKFFGFCLVFLLFVAVHGFSQIGSALGFSQNPTMYKCTELRSGILNGSTIVSDQSGTVQSITVQNTMNGGLYIQINYKNGTTESLTLINPITNRGGNKRNYDVSHINTQPAAGLFGQVFTGSRGEVIQIEVSTRISTDYTGELYLIDLVISISLQPW